MKVRSYRNNVEHTLPVKGLSISTGELSDIIRNAVGNKIFNVQFIKKNGKQCGNYAVTDDGVCNVPQHQPDYKKSK